MYDEKFHSGRHHSCGFFHKSLVVLSVVFHFSLGCKIVYACMENPTNVHATRKMA